MEFRTYHFYRVRDGWKPSKFHVGRWFVTHAASSYYFGNSNTPDEALKVPRDFEDGDRWSVEHVDNLADVLEVDAMYEVTYTGREPRRMTYKGPDPDPAILLWSGDDLNAESLRVHHIRGVNRWNTSQQDTGVTV